ncbi:hypothetical protein [Streptomyces altiplanensis]
MTTAASVIAIGTAIGTGIWTMRFVEYAGRTHTARLLGTVG